jgi:hypothetical protein
MADQRSGWAGIRGYPAGLRRRWCALVYVFPRRVQSSSFLT